MRIPHDDALLSQPVVHGAGVDAKLGADHGQRVAMGVHQNSVLNLFDREPLRTCWHFVTFEDRAHRSPVDSILLGQRGHQGARSVVHDEVGLLGLGEPSLLLLWLGGWTCRTGSAAEVWLRRGHLASE